MHHIDMGRILGPDRIDPFGNKLMGLTPEQTFANVKAHSFKGCCRRHDEERAAEARKHEASLAHGEPDIRKYW